jgi:hypothetical protein
VHKILVQKCSIQAVGYTNSSDQRIFGQTTGLNLSVYLPILFKCVFRSLLSIVTISDVFRSVSLLDFQLLSILLLVEFLLFWSYIGLCLLLHSLHVVSLVLSNGHPSPPLVFSSSCSLFSVSTLVQSSYLPRLVAYSPSNHCFETC